MNTKRVREFFNQNRAAPVHSSGVAARAFCHSCLKLLESCWYGDEFHYEACANCNNTNKVNLEFWVKSTSPLAGWHLLTAQVALTPGKFTITQHFLDQVSNCTVKL